MKAPRSASFGGHEKPALELSHFTRRVVGCCHHALALTPRYGHDQSRALSLQRLSPPSSLLWAPRTPSRHDRISPSAYTHRLRPTWAAEEGLPSSVSGFPCVLASIPRKRPAPLRHQRAVCCLRPDMTGSATSPFGFLSHGAAKFTLSHSARRFAPLARNLTASAGLSTLRSGAALSDDTRSLLRGAPALTAAGLTPASLIQHRSRVVQTRPRSGRSIQECYPVRRSHPGRSQETKIGVWRTQTGQPRAYEIGGRVIG